MNDYADDEPIEVMSVISEDYLWEEAPLDTFNVDDFHNFLTWAVLEKKANDIFIETHEPLGIKVNGETHNVSNQIIGAEEVSFLLSEIYQESAASELLNGEHFDFPYTFIYNNETDATLRFRVHVSACNSIKAANEGIEITLRPSEGKPPSVQELGVCKELIDITNQKEGLVFITGPTGSGKTTLIASLLMHIIQTQRKHVLTAEDPIEYDLKLIPNRLSRVVQSEIPLNVKTYSEAISNDLRRSPDVILIGELRTLKSIEGGILIAQTGHLVFATGHTNNVAGALDRLADEFPPGERQSKLMKLASSVKAVIHQRLMPKLRGGRIAVQERLFITTKIRLAMYAALNSQGSVTHLLDELVQTEGLPLKRDIKEKFSEGILHIEDCLVQLAEGLNQEDMVFFQEETVNLHTAGIISDEEKVTWLDLIGVFNV